MLNDDLSVDRVFAKGRIMVDDGKAVVTGISNKRTAPTQRSDPGVNKTKNEEFKT